MATMAKELEKSGVKGKDAKPEHKKGEDKKAAEKPEGKVSEVKADDKPEVVTTLESLRGPDGKLKKLKRENFMLDTNAGKILFIDYQKAAEEDKFTVIKTRMENAHNKRVAALDKSRKLILGKNNPTVKRQTEIERLRERIKKLEAENAEPATSDSKPEGKKD